jgi:hypothetical protein
MFLSSTFSLSKDERISAFDFLCWKTQETINWVQLRLETFLGSIMTQKNNNMHPLNTRQENENTTLDFI